MVGRTEGYLRNFISFFALVFKDERVVFRLVVGAENSGGFSFFLDDVTFL